MVDLPLSLTVKTITRPESLYISNLGTGGSSVTPEPYSYPLINIPINETAVYDSFFYNVEPLRFSTFSVDSGFVLIPVRVPGNLSENLVLSGVGTDSERRVFYNTCSKEFKFIAEGLLTPAPRKIFIPFLCQVIESDNRLLLKGEYIMVIVSRNVSMDTENYTGYIEDDKSVLAVYRLQNRPLGRV